MTPELAPAVLGEKEIVTTWLAPGASVNGNVGLTMLNPLPVTVPAVTCVVADPGFDIVTV
jgi:hypothetical protein